MSAHSLVTDPSPRVTARPFARHGMCVELAGELDIAAVPQLREAIAAGIDEGHRHFVFDLGSASLLDCACLATILQGMRPLRNEDDATLVLAGASGTVRRLLTLVQFDRQCPIVSTVATATAVALDRSDTRAQGWRRSEPDAVSSPA